MGIAQLEPLMANGPWAFVLTVSVPVLAIVIMFVCAMWKAPAERRAEIIHAMAELVRALRPGKRGGVP